MDRCYWEVTLHNKYVDNFEAIGVAYKSFPRRGQNFASMLGMNDVSWSLLIKDEEDGGDDNDEDVDMFFSFFKTGVISANKLNLSTIGVYLDWQGGTLSFYGISTDKHTHLLTIFEEFTEPLYPAFMAISPGSVIRLLEPSTSTQEGKGTSIGSV